MIVLKILPYSRTYDRENRAEPGDRRSPRDLRVTSLLRRLRSGVIPAAQKTGRLLNFLL